MTFENIDKKSLREEAVIALSQFGSAEALLQMALINGQMGAELISEAEAAEMLAALEAERIDVEKVIALNAFATEDSVGRAFANNAQEQNHTFQFEAAEIAFQMKVLGLDIFQPGVEVEDTPEITPEMEQKADAD